MSNHVARPGAGRRPSKLAVYVGFPLLVIAAIPIGFYLNHRWLDPDPSWRSYPAEVTASRITQVGTVDSNYGGRIFYRIEVRASWNENGSRQNAWVPTTTISSDQESLKLLLWRHNITTCVVRRAPHNSSFLQADLTDEMVPLHPNSARTGN
jgi:hypothetical protein